MRFHQVIASSPVKIKCRDISCACLREQGKFDCPCFELKEVELVDNGQTAASPLTKLLLILNQRLLEVNREPHLTKSVVGVFFSVMV